MPPEQEANQRYQGGCRNAYTDQISKMRQEILFSPAKPDRPGQARQDQNNSPGSDLPNLC